MRPVAKELLNQMASALSPLGYVANISQQRFLKPFPGGKLCVHFAFVPHPNEVNVIVDVAVRHDSIEELLGGDRDHLSEKEKRMTFTVGAELGHIVGVGQKRWTIEDSGDMRAIANDILRCFTQYGEPFLTRYSSVEALRNALNIGGSELKLICPLTIMQNELRLAIAELDAKNA